MARPASVEVAGYFPTPASVLPRIASLVSWPGGSGHGVLLDPCAGEGQAIAALRRAWTRPGSGAFGHGGPPIVACELEAERAAKLEGLGHYRDRAFHGDAFRLLPASELGGGGATVLYLNPPYDHDPEHGRLEQRFLARFTEHLAAGSGVLLFLVPHAALPASAEFLARQYAELRCWRLPRPEYDAFGQVLVAGRRRAEALEAAPGSAGRVLGWAPAPEALPELPERCAEPYAIPSAGSVWYGLEYRLAEVDVPAAAAAFEPWPGGETGGRLGAGELLGARFPVALPPRPAHIALALAAGMFNGHRLDPDEPDRLPPLLAKGSYTREAVEIDRREAEDGTASIVTVDRPRLTVTVLRLDDSTFHTLAEGTEPAGGDDIARWTAADLLLRYGRSMAALLRQQFPPLHDPAEPAHRLALPRLARRPFAAQDQAVQAAVKLLATGRNPFFVAEVGTGKTTMALYVTAALSPAHHAGTARVLRRLGLGVPPVVPRTLVLCPPHLLGSWRDQAAAVVPEARVRIVEEAADLEADADLFILSRERAKLGHGHRGIAGACPRCGSAVLTDAESNASRRLRCTARGRRPGNLFARVAVDLAALLAHAAPADDLVASLAPRRLVAHFRRIGSVALPPGRLALFRDGLLAHLAAAARESRSWERVSLVEALVKLLVALGEVLGESLSQVAQRIERLSAGESDESAARHLRAEARTLRARHAGDDHTGTGRPERRLLGALEELNRSASWQTSGPCGEPLYQAVPPRRAPLARVILRRHRRRFDLVILDEAHEFNNSRSAQAKAAHRLTGLPGVPTLVLTGSLMGGYASSLFANFHALSSAFRREFGRGEEGAFVGRYGYQKVRLTLKGGRDVRLGRHTDREVASRKVIGEAPGVHPLFLMRYLLDTAVTVHKDDLEDALPPLTEEPVPLEEPAAGSRDAELLAEYGRLQAELLGRIRADRRDPDRAGRLLGALVELPSYLDRATDDLEPFAIRYPESLGGEEVALGKSFPAGWWTPKERWLLDELARRIGAGERVLVFLRHSRTRLPERLLRLIRSVAPGAVWLDTPKVPTKRREAWIDRHVNDAGAPVLLVNPNAVRTGLNNLVGFSTAIWYELDYSAFTYRQAIGRLHRIGQTRPVTVLIPYYTGTAQQLAFELVAKKVTASLQVDGLDVRAALEAAGAGDSLPDGLDAALSLGKAMYRVLAKAA